jgi:hypothetical protein
MNSKVHRWIWAVVFMLFSLSSCSEGMVGISKPADLIPRDSMVSILQQMTLIEAHIQTNYSHVSRFQGIMKNSGEKVLKKFAVSPSRYASSFDYYCSRQKEMQSIYAEVLDSLNRFSGLQEEKMIDSLNSKGNLQPSGETNFPSLKR